MGSGGSKACGYNDVPSSSSSSSKSCSIIRRARSRGSKLFFPSCLRPRPRVIQISNHHTKESGPDGPCTEQTETGSNQVITECCNKDNIGKPAGLPCVSSISDLDEWNETTFPNTASGAGSSSAQNSSVQTLNPSSHFLSRFSFIPGNMSFRLSRATSVGSSRAYPVSSTNFTISDNQEEFHLDTQPASHLFIGNETRQGSESLSGCLTNRSQMRHYEGTSGNLGLNGPAYEYSGNWQDGNLITNNDTARDYVNSTTACDTNVRSPRNLTEIDNMDSRRADRRTTTREPVESNVHFSRTLSVGRLRDRVLRQSSIPDWAAFSLRQERDERDAGQSSHGQARGAEASSLLSEVNAAISPTLSGNPLSTAANSLFNNGNYEVEASRPRQSRYHDLLEHRSNFLERRRRIRSQVRALQRLGNRFENLSGHERSCILSGQHRLGRCSCRISSRDANSNDDTAARASISRIVMLAEALFEVLDEIHQQSVVLSSRPSVSAIGSVPAPIEVVDSLPVKLHTKLQKQQIEDAAQCYICLLEYEEGDTIRILPCHHEFHKACIDKWLKEIHRVCPLCRGDICRSDSLPAEN